MHGESTVLSTCLCVSLYFFLSSVVATIIPIIASPSIFDKIRKNMLESIDVVRKNLLRIHFQNYSNEYHNYENIYIAHLN